MTAEDKKMMHKLDKNLVELTVILRNQSSQIGIIFEEQAKRESETKEILQHLSSSIEQNRNMSSRLVFLLKKIEKISEDSIELAKHQEICKLNFKRLDAYNKKVTASLLGIGGTVLFYLFTIVTEKTIG